MKKNVGNIDRIIRIVAGAVLLLLYFGYFVTGTLGLILLILGCIFLITGFTARCPLYSLLDVDTCPVKKKQVSR